MTKLTTKDHARIEEIAERFKILDDMTKAAIEGKVRAMIVSGPPGVGKSYGVEQQVQKYSNDAPRCSDKLIVSIRQCLR